MRGYTRITFSRDACETFQVFLAQLGGVTALVKPPGGARSFPVLIQDVIKDSQTGDEIVVRKLDELFQPFGEAFITRVQNLYVF